MRMADWDWHCGSCSVLKINALWVPVGYFDKLVMHTGSQRIEMLGRGSTLPF